MDAVFIVQVEVPLGIRNGRMIFHQNNKKVYGELKILGNVESFIGEIHEDGTVSIKGHLTSVIRSMPYCGTGSICNGQIRMQLDTERSSYQLTGYECNYKEKGRKVNEKVL